MNLMKAWGCGSSPTLNPPLRVACLESHPFEGLPHFGLKFFVFEVYDVGAAVSRKSAVIMIMGEDPPPSNSGF